MSRKTLIHRIQRLASRLIRGEICLSCGREWHGSAEICDSCIELMPSVSQPCQLCGLTNRAAAEHPVCPGCLIDPPRWQAMFSPFHYSGTIRQALLQAKFAADLPPVKSLCLGHATDTVATGLLPEVLIPVPLHASRWRERGFNQAAEIASFWSQRFNIPVDHQSLRRIKNTVSQSGLNARARRRNIRGAFTCDVIPYQHVAIVDDIITTGSTLDEITRVLQARGAEFIEVWAVARACRKDQKS